jgi:hypothetical protein
MLTGAATKPTRHLTTLLMLIGSADEIASVDNLGFAKRAGKIIAGAAANMRRRRRIQLPSVRSGNGEPALVSAGGGAGSAMPCSVAVAT